MTEQSAVRDNVFACAGMILGPALWAANTQLGQILPYIDCPGGLRLSAITSFMAALLSLVGGFISSRARTADTARALRERLQEIQLDSERKKGDNNSAENPLCNSLTNPFQLIGNLIQTADW